MFRILALCALCFGLAAPAAAAPVDCSDVQAVPGTEVRMQLVARVSQPVDVTAIPGDRSRLFILEQRGRVRVVQLPSDEIAAAPYLDIQSRVQSGGEQGLLGLAFHPNYSENGELFVYYTSRAGGGDSVISRFRASATDPNAADPTSEEVLLTFDQPFSNHNGGQIQFGPNDGYLYIATGDGGNGGDPGNRAQNGNSLLGKMLRIDVDTTTGGLPYGIPADNPFVDSGNVRGEIWALGLRNPWRFDFDNETGDLYIGDVGQGTWEEIDFQPASSRGGENYEWRVREGDHNFQSQSYGAGTRVGPIFEYNHGTGRSVTGGVVYRGCRMPELRGTYFFADYANNWVRSFRYENGSMAEMKLRTGELNSGAERPLRSVSAFGEDAAGEIYVCDHSFGGIYRIVPAFIPPGTFTRGDGNGDKEFNVADVVFGLDQLFGGEQTGEIACHDSLDANDDGGIDISDAAYSLNFLFGGGPAPGAPFSECGADPTEDELDCEASICP